MSKTERFLLVIVIVQGLVCVNNQLQIRKNTALILRLSETDSLAVGMSEDVLRLVGRNTELVGKLNDKDVIMTDTLQKMHRLITLYHDNR